MGVSLTSPSFHLRSVMLILVSSVKLSPTVATSVAKTPVSPSGVPPADTMRISPGLISFNSNK